MVIGAGDPYKQVLQINEGTSGMGLGLAEAFMKQGDAVAVCGRGQAALDHLPVNTQTR